MSSIYLPCSGIFVGCNIGKITQPWFPIPKVKKERVYLIKQQFNIDRKIAQPLFTKTIKYCLMQVLDCHVQHLNTKEN